MCWSGCPPPRPGLPRPRFSLYLSSQLQYGVVLVYHRQCVILLEELQSVLVQILRQRSTKTIDLESQSRKARVLPDTLSLLEEAGGALDPLFGVMRELMPSPSALMEMTPERQRDASSPPPEASRPETYATPEVETGITASPDSITMREPEPVTIPRAEFEGEDLIDRHPDIIDILLAQDGHFPEELPREEATPGEGEPERQRPDREGMLTPRQATSEHAPLTPPPGPDTPARPARDQRTPTPEPAGPPPPAAETRPERRPGSLQQEGSPEVTAASMKKRRRQLVFFDPETQLSQEEQEQRLQDPLTETRPPVLLPTPSLWMPPASELLNTPRSFLPEEIRFLWRQAATITPLFGSDLLAGERGPESSDSEREQERMEEVAEIEEQRVDVQREMMEPEMFDTSAQGTLPLEASDQPETSQEISPLVSLEREGSTVSRSVSLLQDIPEVQDEAMDALGEESPGLMPGLEELEEEPLLFHSLLPAGAGRAAVSRAFQRLLENLTARKICAEQDQPYGDISIFPGPGYQDLRSVV
ncbi:unnamed protein product [Menidia menidia]|uniref:(Atlantic silverside) hypothetical protein n=1 Tax=Menidia menidia TaxID=238744 RepID=A0A8S4BR93_9TELE|nr:unnamed protein product [Menidia menidia]